MNVGSSSLERSVQQLRRERNAEKPFPDDRAKTYKRAGKADPLVRRTRYDLKKGFRSLDARRSDQIGLVYQLQVSMTSGQYNFCRPM